MMISFVAVPVNPSTLPVLRKREQGKLFMWLL